MLPVTWLGLPLRTVQYVMYFCFVDDVMCSHNGANGPESKTMLFHRVGQLKHQLDIRQCCLVESARWQHQGQSLMFTTALL